MDVSPRSLLPSERALVVGLLRHAGIPALDYLHQLDSLRVLAECDCGCSSIDFQPEAEGVRIGGAHILVDAYGVTPTGQNVGLILWGSERVLTGLELYSLDSDPPFAAPAPETITDMPPTPTWFEESS